MLEMLTVSGMGRWISRWTHIHGGWVVKFCLQQKRKKILGQVRLNFFVIWSYYVAQAGFEP